MKSNIQEDGRIKVLVADTGAGIEPHDVARIFDPLFTKKSDDIGMGLSICRAIIEAHNGQIWFAQNQPQGAFFQFVLPAVRQTTWQEQQPGKLAASSCR